MACNKPFLRYLNHHNNKLGFDCAIPVPCGHCAGCLKDYTQAWSDRCTFRSRHYRKRSPPREFNAYADL